MDFEMTFKPVTVKLNIIARLRGLLSILIAYIAVRCFPLAIICRGLMFFKRFSSRKITITEANIAWAAIRQSNFVLGRLACLELSLAFFIFCLTKGLLVTWCVGVINKPFRSHAWIEINGEPFREDNDFVYRKLITI